MDLFKIDHSGFVGRTPVAFCMVTATVKHKEVPTSVDESEFSPEDIGWSYLPIILGRN